jgi:hypothetical protein
LIARLKIARVEAWTKAEGEKKEIKEPQEYQESS